jgi:hypothetical protein
LKTLGQRIETAKEMLRNDESNWQIAMQTHFTPNKISQLKKEILGIGASPVHTKAYAKFQYEGKGILNLAMELGLSQEQSERFNTEYLMILLKIS